MKLKELDFFLGKEHINKLMSLFDKDDKLDEFKEIIQYELKEDPKLIIKTMILFKLFKE